MITNHDCGRGRYPIPECVVSPCYSCENRYYAISDYRCKAININPMIYKAKCSFYKPKLSDTNAADTPNIRTSESREN